VHAPTHIHTQTNTDTETYTQTQTHTDPHTYTDTHRHTQTQRHKGTETQRHRDTDSFSLSLFLPRSIVLSLSRFLFPFLCLPDAHTLSPLTTVLRLPIAAYNDILVRSGESTYTTTTCALIVGSPLCGRSLLNAGVWQCTRFSQFFYWRSLTNDPKMEYKKPLYSHTPVFRRLPPQRGIPGINLKAK